MIFLILILNLNAFTIKDVINCELDSLAPKINEIKTNTECNYIIKTNTWHCECNNFKYIKSETGNIVKIKE